MESIFKGIKSRKCLESGARRSEAYLQRCSMSDINRPESGDVKVPKRKRGLEYRNG